MRDFSISVVIKASPQRVWDVMSDGERWHEWTPSITSVKLLDRSLAVGNRAIVRQPELPPARFKITEVRPGRNFTWTTGIPGILFAHAYHGVEPAPEGARATLRLRFDGLLGHIMGKRMADLNNRYLTMEAAGLKRFSEEGPRDPNVSLDEWNAEARRSITASERL